MKNKLTKIFPFPTVQYIPLAITTLSTGSLAKLDQKNNLAKIIADEDLLACQETLKTEYGITIPRFPADTCPILLLNLEVTTVKYRSFYLTMLGQATPGRYQLFTIPKARLYKDKLYFEVYQAETGEKLASYSRFLPTSKVNAKLPSFYAAQKQPTDKPNKSLRQSVPKYNKLKFSHVTLR